MGKPPIRMPEQRFRGFRQRLQVAAPDLRQSGHANIGLLVSGAVTEPPCGLPVRAAGWGRLNTLIPCQKHMPDNEIRSLMHVGLMQPEMDMHCVFSRCEGQCRILMENAHAPSDKEIAADNQDKREKPEPPGVDIEGNVHVLKHTKPNDNTDGQQAGKKQLGLGGHIFVFFHSCL